MADPPNPAPSWVVFLMRGVRPAALNEIPEADRRCCICMTGFCDYAHNLDDEDDKCVENSVAARVEDSHIATNCVDRSGFACEQHTGAPRHDCEECGPCPDGAEHAFKLLACQHHYLGWRCLIRWLRRSNSCPICRTELYDRDTLDLFAASFPVVEAQEEDMAEQDGDESIEPGDANEIETEEESDVDAPEEAPEVPLVEQTFLGIQLSRMPLGYEELNRMSMDNSIGGARLQAIMDRCRPPPLDYAYWKRYYRERFFFEGVPERTVTIRELDNEVRDMFGYRQVEFLPRAWDNQFLEVARCAPAAGSVPVERLLIGLPRIQEIQRSLAGSVHRADHFLGIPTCHVRPEQCTMHIDSIIDAIGYPRAAHPIQWHIGYMRARLMATLIRRGARDVAPEAWRAELVTAVYPPREKPRELQVVLGEDDSRIGAAWNEWWWDVTKRDQGGPELNFEAIVGPLPMGPPYSHAIDMVYATDERIYGLLQYVFLVVSVMVAHVAFESEKERRTALPHPELRANPFENPFQNPFQL